MTIKSIYLMQEVHDMDITFSIISHYFLVLVLNISESDYNMINCFHDDHNY